MEALNAISPFYKGLVAGLFIGANIGILALGLLAASRDRDDRQG
mgnify:FL=1